MALDGAFERARTEVAGEAFLEEELDGRLLPLHGQLRLRRPRRSNAAAISLRRMPRMVSSDSGRKTTTRSMRLMNSLRNSRSSALATFDA
jgi:hypothetical protein